MIILTNTFYLKKLKKEKQPGRAIVVRKYFLKYCRTFAEKHNALAATNISEINESFKLFLIIYFSGCPPGLQVVNLQLAMLQVNKNLK